MKLFAHRGLSADAPENTMAAFRAAYQAGFTWIETDVDITADGTLPLCHDATLERTTTGHGRVDELRATDLETLDAGSWFSPGFAGEKIPTLAQLVDYALETGMGINIEMKPCAQGGEQARALVRAVAQQARRLGPERALVSSFSHLQLAEFARHAPEIPRGALFERASFGPDWRTVLDLTDARYLHVSDDAVTAAVVAQARAAGRDVHVYTVNNPERARQLERWGVAGIFTDGFVRP
ncbi:MULTISPECIES: glycerophosphodiester phosphodiesterase family protein [Actinotignum]|nr:MULTISPECIES: glycerophosphodiester phosphodiesterase family protein [Actinotignum]MDE1536525.1 glycerophosphodiester phosphodiesterase family protein [Actinotignum schaalii]MDK7270786.1 glycerophosphodiester phosphodiesterase family protein [Actinotignum schaalii]MDY5143916.1 glycerophosphodiester phosphodiesterase family protein [Actinotignum timonense]